MQKHAVNEIHVEGPRLHEHATVAGSAGRPLNGQLKSSGPKYASVSRCGRGLPSSSRRTDLLQGGRRGLVPADGQRPGCPSPAWDVPGHPHTADGHGDPHPAGPQAMGPAQRVSCPQRAQPARVGRRSAPGPASILMGALSSRPVPPDLANSLGLSGVKGTGSLPRIPGPVELYPDQLQKVVLSAHPASSESSRTSCPAVLAWPPAPGWQAP